MKSVFVFSVHKCIKSWATITWGFSFFLAERWLALSPAFSVFLGGLLPLCTPLGPGEEWLLCLLPACILHPLLHSASLSGLLTAAVQLSFYVLLTGVFWSQTVSEKKVYLHKQCHVRRSAGNKIKIQWSKSSWSTHFFFATNTSYMTICMLKYGWEFE